MKRMSWMMFACAFSAGCGEVTVPPAATIGAPTEVRLPLNLAITEKTLDEPLTPDEVLSFLALVEAFPEGKLPTFDPISARAKVQGMRLDEAIVAWRRAVRHALSVETLMQGWAPRSSVRNVLNENRIHAREITSLMLRLSCAIGAESMGGRRNVIAQRVIADEKVESLVARIQQLDRSKQPIADAYWESLEEATSLAEYLAVLSEVPPESVQMIAEHKQQLAPLLPAPSHLSAPQDTFEEDRIVPVRFEELSRDEPRSSSRRTR